MIFKIQKAETKFLFFIAMLSRIQYFCFKYEERKQHNDKWKEPPAIEFIIPMIVTEKVPKYKGYMRGYSH